MNNIQIFKYENNDVRTVEMNGEPWFVGKDVASVLGYKDTVNALKPMLMRMKKLGGKSPPSLVLRKPPLLTNQAFTA